MTTSHQPAAGESPQVIPDHLTLRWFAKRSGLWLLSVASGIGLACFLYAYASDETNSAELQARTIAVQAAQTGH